MSSALVHNVILLVSFHAESNPELIQSENFYV